MHPCAPLCTPVHPCAQLPAHTLRATAAALPGMDSAALEQLHSGQDTLSRCMLLKVTREGSGH